LKIIRACHDDQTVAFTTVINAVIPPRASIYIGDNGAPPRIVDDLFDAVDDRVRLTDGQERSLQPLS
jgi:hypothetical protein